MRKFNLLYSVQMDHINTIKLCYTWSVEHMQMTILAHSSPAKMVSRMKSRWLKEMELCSISHPPLGWYLLTTKNDKITKKTLTWYVSTFVKFGYFFQKLSRILYIFIVRNRYCLPQNGGKMTPTHFRHQWDPQRPEKRCLSHKPLNSGWVVQLVCIEVRP